MRPELLINQTCQAGLDALIEDVWGCRRGHVYICEVQVTREVFKRAHRTGIALGPAGIALGPEEALLRFDFELIPEEHFYLGKPTFGLRCGSCRDSSLYPAKAPSVFSFEGLYSRLWLDTSKPCGWYVFFLEGRAVWFRLHMAENN